MPKPGFSILVCPDAALLNEHIEKTSAQWGKARRLVFWGDEEPSDAFWESLQQIGLFGEKRIVVGRRAELLSAAAWKGLSRALAKPMDHIWPFLCLEVEKEKGAFKIPAHIKNLACFKFADKQGWIWREEGLQGKIEPFVKNHAANLKLNFPPGLLNGFCAGLPPDANAILNELQKLLLLAPDGVITPEILPDNPFALENDAFALLGHLWTGNIPALWKELENDSEGSLLFFVIALLARDFRILWQLLAGEKPYLPPQQVQAKRNLAVKLGFAGIAKGFAALAEAEWQVKSGRLPPPRALEVLVMAILRLASRA